MAEQRKNRGLLVGMSVALEVLRTTFFSKESQIDNICIRGSEDFRKKVSSSLILLRDKDPEIFKKVNEHLTFVVEAPATLLSLAKIVKGTLALGPEQANTSEVWLAGIFAYEGARSALYYEGLKKIGNSRKVPEELYSDERVWDTYYESLKRLGANYDQLKYVADLIEIQQL